MPVGTITVSAPKFVEASRDCLGWAPKIIAVSAISMIVRNTMDGGVDIWCGSAKFEDDRTYEEWCELLFVERSAMRTDTSKGGE